MSLRMPRDRLGEKTFKFEKFVAGYSWTQNLPLGTIYMSKLSKRVYNLIPDDHSRWTVKHDLCFGRRSRLVFTSDGVGVGVVIRSIKRYDLVKIKLRSRKQSFLLRLRFRRLRSSENQFVGVLSRSGRTKPIIKRGNEHRDWFSYPSASASDSDNLVFTRSKAMES